MSTVITVCRVPVPSAVHGLGGLLAAHAAYEEASLGGPVAEVLDRLDQACAAGRVEVFVAFDGDDALGYASLTTDLATWSGREFGHLDCLFVRAGERGRNVGRLLVDAVRERCRLRGLRELQWQTPVGNEDAIRFYRRLGARDATKARFTWEL
ncbi:GNAT family N-acetyltransferase [Kitasatospora sp. NPDC018619]|uniref:GNAT family N-acetyltransferase n=1 Tax=unclassified Kitasatospora TaxID=2633591 RepID=UPI003787699C